MTIVQMMGGRIGIKSEVGKGTDVNIYMSQRIVLSVKMQRPFGAV